MIPNIEVREALEELSQTAARAMSDEQLQEQSVVVAIFAQAIRDELHRRGTLEHIPTAGNA